MFFKGSRYKKLADEITHDSEGRARRSKELRLARNAEGTFIHYLAAEDRLDHLAYKYYQQSQKWWRICDANPKSLSPLELVGQESLSLITYIVACNHPRTVFLPDVIQGLYKKNGVIDVTIKRVPSWDTDCEEHDGNLREIVTEIDTYEINVQFHNETVLLPEIENVITEPRFIIDENVTTEHRFIIKKKIQRSRLGKPIHIPPHTLE